MVPSPKLKMTRVIGVWSVSLDSLASAVTVRGAGPKVTGNLSAATGGESGPGVGVAVGAMVGALLGLVGTLVGWGVTCFTTGAAAAAALDGRT